MSETAEAALTDVLAIALRAPRDLPASHPSDYERDGRDLQALLPRIVAALMQPQQPGRVEGMEARPLAEYHEDYGFVVWWKFPMDEPAWIGSPNCSDWPGYHTHWTPHPSPPTASSQEPDHGSAGGAK